jgi:NAD-dependent dihydropyrimidine dehydrogenase PreA subunit
MPVKRWENNLMGIFIEIDYDLCTGCDVCTTICLSDVFTLYDGKSICLQLEDCTECCDCVVECPVQAISHSSCKL